MQPNTSKLRLCISAGEVENVLLGHDAVVEAAVVGAEEADQLIKPKAFVVLASDKQASAAQGGLGFADLDRLNDGILRQAPMAKLTTDTGLLHTPHGCVGLNVPVLYIICTKMLAGVEQNIAEIYRKHIDRKALPSCVSRESGQDIVNLRQPSLHFCANAQSCKLQHEQDT